MEDLEVQEVNNYILRSDQMFLIYYESKLSNEFNNWCNNKGVKILSLIIFGGKTMF